jgi:TatA/E family protein of Tat protein translocase
MIHSSLAFIEGLGGPEMLMIMVVILMLFGANRLPELAKGIGKSMREFKKAASGVEEEVRRAMEEEPAKPAPKPAGTIEQQAGAPKPPISPTLPPPAAD